MGLALILLGLLPLAFMGVMYSGDDGTEDEAPDDGADGSETLGNIFAQSSAAYETAGDGADTILKPLTEDETPFEGEEVDPDSVLYPDIDLETPEEGEPVDPDTIVAPETGAGTGEHSTALAQLLSQESDLDGGADWLDTYGPDLATHTLDDSDNSFALADDGATDTGEGVLSIRDGSPVLSVVGEVALVDGADGNDVIGLGDQAAYAFGGAGDDVIDGGEGAAAIFGGEGDDTLRAGSGASFVDGGAGDDVAVGGDGDDLLYGGSHDPDNPADTDDDILSGGAGDDQLSGGLGADLLYGGEGDDVIDHYGNADEDVVWEGAEFDWHIDGETDVLDGGDGNDTLIMDQNDIASGGAGMDTFWVYHDGTDGGGFADIQDFEVGVDFLKVSLDPNTTTGTLDVDVTPSADGEDAVVTVNGATIALLRGAADASLADVLFEVTPNLVA